MGWCSPSSSYPRPRFFWTWINSKPIWRAWPRGIKESGKALRPHAKAHKCVEIARRQIAAGAIGVCVATVAEAEMMAAAGIPAGSNSLLTLVSGRRSAEDGPDR